MYANLAKELSSKNITNKAVASMLGCTEKTLYNKISGITDFTISESICIQRNLLPEFQIVYLFAADDQPA